MSKSTRWIKEMCLTFQQRRISHTSEKLQMRPLRKTSRKYPGHSDYQVACESFIQDTRRG